MKSAAMKMTTNGSSVDSSTLALRYADATLRHYKIIVEVCAVGALCTLGIAGNVLSIVVLGRDRTVRRTTGFMLQMLAVSDAVFLLDTESALHVAALDTIHVRRLFRDGSLQPVGLLAQYGPTLCSWSRVSSIRRSAVSSTGPTGCQQVRDVGGLTSRCTRGRSLPSHRLPPCGWWWS